MGATPMQPGNEVSQAQLLIS